MMFWSPEHGQLFEDWVLVVLLACSTVTFFLIHHVLETEEPLDNAEEMLEESQTLRRSTRLERTYRETLLLIDAELKRPAMHAALRGRSRQLRLHRKHLERLRIFAYVAFVLFVPLLLEMILFSEWKGEVLREWLFYGSLTYQAMFVVAAGNYTNVLWEDIASCGIFLLGLHSLPRHCWKHFVTFVMYFLRHLLFLFMLLVGAKMWLPGLGLAALLWEAPMVPLLYRESWMASNRPAVWMLENAAPLWRFALGLLICVRLPVIVMLVITSVYLEIPSDGPSTSLEIRLYFHVSVGLLVVGGIFHVVVLWQQYQSDNQWIKEAKSHGWPPAAGKERRNVEEQDEEGMPVKSACSCCATSKRKRKSQGRARSDSIETEKDKENDKMEALPVCTLHQLPELPKERNVAEMQTVHVLSSPLGSLA